MFRANDEIGTPHERCTWIRGKKSFLAQKQRISFITTHRERDTLSPSDPCSNAMPEQMHRAAPVIASSQEADDGGQAVMEQVEIVTAVHELPLNQLSSLAETVRQHSWGST